MSKPITILYVHGMGGGGDSRIPSILKEHIPESLPDNGVKVDVVVRTYDFDPEISRKQVDSWVSELDPDLIIGESLGSLNAIALKGRPHILVSPSLNAPLYFYNLAFLTLIPGMTWLLDRIYRPKEGDRQKLHFTFRTMRKYGPLRKRTLANAPANGSDDYFYAYFGESDHFRRTGIVSVRTWRKYFGDCYETYPGTHFMEEEFLLSRLIPKVLKILNIK